MTYYHVISPPRLHITPKKLGSLGTRLPNSHIIPQHMLQHAQICLSLLKSFSSHRYYDKRTILHLPYSRLIHKLLPRLSHGYFVHKWQKSICTTPKDRPVNPNHNFSWIMCSISLAVFYTVFLVTQFARTIIIQRVHFFEGKCAAI